MSNLLLLCHGGLREFGTFELTRTQTIQYRGNFGALIDEVAARRIVHTLLQDPTVSDQQLGREIVNYRPTDPITGPGGFGPDIDLGGGGAPPCFFVDLSTHRRFDLDMHWRTRLSQLIQTLPADFYLDLVCCTDAGIRAVGPQIEPFVAVRSWADVFHS
jgi:hypothetical protein